MALATGQHTWDICQRTEKNHNARIQEKISQKLSTDHRTQNTEHITRINNTEQRAHLINEGESIT